MLFSTYQQKVISKKTNKKRFKILEKGKYVTPDEIFEAFVGIDDDLTMMMNTPTYWTFKDVEKQMMHDNTFSLLFVTIFLTYSVQCCYNVETSPLIYTTNYCTGFYIIATLE